MRKPTGETKTDTQTTRTRLARNLRLSQSEETGINRLSYWQREELKRLATNVTRTKSFSDEVRLTGFIRSIESDVELGDVLAALMSVFRESLKENIVNQKSVLERLVLRRKISEFLRRELQRLSEQSARLAEQVRENHSEAEAKQPLNVRGFGETRSDLHTRGSLPRRRPGAKMKVTRGTDNRPEENE